MYQGSDLLLGILPTYHQREKIGSVFRYNQPSVSQAIKRGEKFAKENDLKLLS